MTNMKLKESNHKCRSHTFGLYTTLLERLEKLPASRTGIISFPDTFLQICRAFQLTKEQGWELLLILRDFGLIDVVRQKGIRIKKTGVCRWKF